MISYFRTIETIKFNNQLKIVKLLNVKFQSPDKKETFTISKKFALYIEGKGYLASKDNFIPYIPLGGKSVLQSLISTGAFINYEDFYFINPMPSIG